MAANTDFLTERNPDAVHTRGTGPENTYVSINPLVADSLYHNKAWTPSMCWELFLDFALHGRLSDRGKAAGASKLR